MRDWDLELLRVRERREMSVREREREIESCFRLFFWNFLKICNLILVNGLGPIF